MKQLITFDYELFFGNYSGTIENCIIEPTNQLISLGSRYNAFFTFFVDAGYLLALERNASQYPNLYDTYDKIRKQIDKLYKNGHDIQLHVHPHWQDTIYSNGNWLFNTERYKLADFPQKEVNEIISSYKTELSNIVGEENIFAYRAGGWCIQPFMHIKNALKENNIWLDSTIYYNGLNVSETKGYDFLRAPKKDLWKFEDDPQIEDPDGFFIELPISAIKVKPFFYWKLMVNKLLKSNKITQIGDGNSLSSGNQQYLKLLLKSSSLPVSVDNYKSILLNKAYKKLKNEQFQYLVSIGHPKCISKFALLKIEEYIETASGNNDSFVGFRDIKNHLKNG